MIDADDVIEIENEDDLELALYSHHIGTDTTIRIAKEQSSIFELLRREELGLLLLSPDLKGKKYQDISPLTAS